MMRVVTFLTLALAVTGVAAAQPVPALVNYQGRLTDASGAALTGARDLSFKVFAAPCAAAPCGDTPVWGPQSLTGVQLNEDGQFNVILGPTDVDGDSILTAFGDADRYLEVTVESAQPILPRQQVLTAPFAARSRVAGDYGDFKYSARVSDHDGWLICDGRAVSRSAYGELFAVVGTAFGPGDGSSTFNLPDARGRVVGSVGQGDTPTLTNRSLGQEVGEESHVQTVAEMAQHNHNTGLRNGGGGGTTTVYARTWMPDGTPWLYTENAGQSQPFNVMQPTVFAGSLFIFAGSGT